MLLMERIPDESDVLEIGSAAGYLGAYMIAHKNCKVWGVEPFEDSYHKAKNVGYQELVHASAEKVISENYFLGRRFDVILLGDVLEHMVNPVEVLGGLKKLLKDNGRVVVSLPNVAFYRVRLALLFGKWEMQDAGIMDRTHLHFYTKKTASKMIQEAGFVLVSVRPSAGHIEQIGVNRFFAFGRAFLFAFQKLFAVQFIFVAKPRS